MDTTLTYNALMAEQDKRIAETVSRERGRLANFIRRRVPDASEAEDILQEVFYEFVAAYRLPEPIEQAGAWLFSVARNRIIDRFRKKKEEPLPEVSGEADEGTWLDEVLPSPDAGPEAAYARAVLLEELYAALAELPKDQRAVFIAHELDGCSFKEVAAESGVAVKGTSKNPDFIPTAALRKKFLANIYTICGAAKFFPRLAFGRTLNF